MWNHLPSDLLAKIFSFLPPDSLARARSTCRHWHTCGNVYPLSTIPLASRHQSPPWFVALPLRNNGLYCYVHNPIIYRWYELSLDFLSEPIRPLAPIGSIILSRITSSTYLRLGLCNPFTRQFRHLPSVKITRTNPAVGVVILGSSSHSAFPHFRVYVAGGMSEASSRGATYEPTLEMYDSHNNTWQIVRAMPVEFSVRLTVWTPNESVYCNGVLYWMTSARVYIVMGLEVWSNKWLELGVPTADRLEFAALVLRNGRLALVGGTCGSNVFAWEISEGENWSIVDKVPIELALKLKGNKASWGSTKCVGDGGGVICLYRDLSSGMVVWREVGEKGKWEWLWVEGCCYVRGKQVQNLPFKGLMIHPNLASSYVSTYQ